MRNRTAKLLIFFTFLFCGIRLAALTRDDVIRNIPPYTSLSWTVASRNVINKCSSPTWTKTPFTSGTNVPTEAYNWGGFTTPAEFKSAIKGNTYAGNQCTKDSGNPYGRTDNTTGIDCSGFVARLWQLTSKLGTSSSLGSGSVTGVTVPIRGGIAEAKTRMRPGDVYLKDGSHVAMVVASTPNGPTVAEAVSGYWRVVQRPSAWSEWKTYEPRRYKNLQDGGIGLLILISHPTSIRSESKMTAQAKIRENDGNSIKYDEITIAVLKDGSNAFQFDMTHLSNISFKGDESRDLTFTGTAPKAAGKYRLVVRGRIGDRWSDFMPNPPAVNSVPFTVTK